MRRIKTEMITLGKEGTPDAQMRQADAGQPLVPQVRTARQHVRRPPLPRSNASNEFPPEIAVSVEAMDGMKAYLKKLRAQAG